jgi:hypothetical protein
MVGVVGQVEAAWNRWIGKKFPFYFVKNKSFYKESQDII